MKAMFMETIFIAVLDKYKEHYLGGKYKAQKTCDILRNTQLHMSKYKRIEDLQSIISNLQPNCCWKVNFQKVDKYTRRKCLIQITNRHIDIAIDMYLSSRKHFSNR